jgi:hypothetical protein
MDASRRDRIRVECSAPEHDALSNANDEGDADEHRRRPLGGRELAADVRAGPMLELADTG